MNDKVTRLIQAIENLSKQAVYVGVAGEVRSDREGNTINMAELAAIHEFGTAKTPERSFLRTSLTENTEDYKKLLVQQIRGNIIDGAGDPLNVVGAYAAGKAQEKIESGGLTPLDPETIKRKGSSVPLIDTGQLVQSITWVVRDE